MKKNSRRTKKIRNLVFVCILSAILLTVSTYAWFIGMQTVRVNSFEVKIASTDGLMLSLDGENWTTDLDVTSEDTKEYAGNTNQWLTARNAASYTGKGLIPVSTIGDIDSEADRLIMYEKSSLTATKGGYRLLSKRVDNTVTQGKELDGYMAFDLFVRNMSGEAYYWENNQANEEAIYLTYDSDVTVGTSGVSNTGIENSVRVAFAQIGRVENQEYSSQEDATYKVGTVTGITCDTTANESTAGVTGICSRPATIWEPNDTNHVANAGSWFAKSCLNRTAEGSENFNYGTACAGISQGNFYPTYAISREIAVADYVDIYDGAKYNTYTANTVEPTPALASEKQEGVKYFDDYLTAKAGDSFKANDYKLVAVDTFRETEQQTKGATRPEFMTLAPNSITKVRVYVYIEGQDVDNYDFAQLGKAIQVNFGFTKERYTTEDYTDEPVSIIPGAEGVTKVAYAATGAVTEPTATTTSGKGIIYDSETKAFYFLTSDAVATFTFKDGGTQKTATLADGTWSFN